MSAKPRKSRPNARSPRTVPRPPEVRPDTPVLQPHPLDQARLHRGAEHLHRLGPRAMAEFLAELGNRIGGTPACLSLLNEYGRLSPGLVRAAGADRPLRSPLSAVPR